MAETVYYVDTDVVGGAGDGSSWANAYSSLNAAEAARNANITAGNAVAFNCKGATNADVALTIGGWTTDADSYIRVYTETANRHDGKWNTGKYRLTGTNDHVLWIQEDYVRIEGVQIAKTASNANLKAAVYTSLIAASNDIRVSACIIWGDSNASYSQPVIYPNDADTIMTVWNCVIYSSGGSDTVNSCGVLVINNNVKLYGCTVVHARYGIRLGTSLTAVAKNCYFHGGGAPVSLDTGATLTTTTCASSGTTLDVDNVPHDTTTFVNVTAGSEDYHLVAGSGLIGVGTTLSDDPPGSTALGVDIDGETRS